MTTLRPTKIESVNNCNLFEAHAKLHALLPSNDNIQQVRQQAVMQTVESQRPGLQKRDAAIFILIVLPLYLFLAVAESCKHQQYVYDVEFLSEL